MKKGQEKILKYSSEELKTKQSQTDWERVDRLSDNEIDKAISDDRDTAPVLTESWFEKAKWQKPAKQQVHLRLDKDIVDFFKQKGRGYQTRINQVLRAFMEAHSQ